MSLIRQGDVLLVPVTEIPPGTVPVAREHGRVVLAHGEVARAARDLVNGWDDDSNWPLYSSLVAPLNDALARLGEGDA